MKCTVSSGPVAMNESVMLPLWRLSLTVIALSCTSAVAQQSVTAPPPPAPEVSENGPGATGEVLKSPSTAPFQWMRVGFRPHAFYRLTYSEGARARRGQPADTTINAFSPGMTFDLGTRWVADYTQTWTYYSNDAFRDRVAHSANLKGSAAFTGGNAQFAQTYSLTNDTLVETGRQTRQETAATSLVVNYELGRHTRLVAAVSHDLRYVEAAPNSREWSTNDSIHYQFSSRLDTGLAVRYGYVDVDRGADMRFLEPQFQVGWRPVDKLRFDAHVGRQRRTFSGSGLAPLNSSTYGASAAYQPTQTTALTFSADRGVSVSYFSNQVTQNTGWQFGFSQRLLQRLSLSGGYGENQNRYIQASSVTQKVREDDVSNFFLRLGTGFLRRGSVAIVYQKTRNRSDNAGYGFSSTQTGLEIRYAF